MHSFFFVSGSDLPGPTSLAKVHWASEKHCNNMKSAFLSHGSTLLSGLAIVLPTNN